MGQRQKVEHGDGLAKNGRGEEVRSVVLKARGNSVNPLGCKILC